VSTGEKVGDAQRRQVSEAKAESGSPKWMLDGSCSRVDPEAWFPEVGGSPKAAKEICRACPSKEPCLQWAMEHNERWGVWGATTYEERVKMRRAAKREVAA
jgi:WhiB family redox-sensing transcriptional regulator